MADKEVLPPIQLKQLGWPSFWGPDALEEQLAMIHAPAFERGFRQKPQSDEDLIFPHFGEEGTNYKYGTDWKAISDSDDEKNFDKKSRWYVDPEWTRYTGVDLSGKKRRGNVLFTIAVSPDGIRHVVDIRLGNWSGPDVVREIQKVDDNALLKPRRVFVENNAYQESFQDWIKESNVSCWTKVRPFRTGSNKMDLEIGLPAIDIQYSMGRWRIPVSHKKGHPSEPSKKDPTICLCGPCMLIRATLTFTRNDLDETPDTIAAQFIAKEASRQGERYTESSSVLIRVSQTDIQTIVSQERRPSDTLRLPVTLDGRSFLGARKSKSDFGRGTPSNFPHPDGVTVHPSGECFLCDKFPKLQIGSM